MKSLLAGIALITLGLPIAAQIPATGGSYMFNYYLPPPGTGSPWWPCWSPDGESLAFSLQGSLWTIRAGETEAHEIAYGKEYLSSPEWSPNGKWIAYTADDGRAINLKLLDVETGQSISLTRGDQTDVDPAWSPDGSRLAFVSTRGSGRFNIFIMEIQGGKPGPVVAVTRDHSYGRERLYFGEYDLHIQPAWSPGGKELLFISNRGIPLGSGAVWRMPAEAGGIDRARLVHNEETLYRARPQWSPDGKRFIYSSHQGGQYSQLTILPIEGGTPYRLTFAPWDSFQPRWSPDGEQIAYISNQEGAPQLHVLQTHGGMDRKIEIKTLRWSRPMGRVRVRIEDGETGALLAARVATKASDGKAYVPCNVYHRLGGPAGHFFHSAGTFTLDVPEGELFLEARHGFEYYPAQRTLRVRAGQPAEATLKLKRMVNAKARGWWSGSNHVHMSYGGNLHNTPENLIRMAEAEDLGVITALVANKDTRVLDYAEFTGAPNPVSTARHVLYFNEEYRPPFYGHMSLVNLTRTLLSPFTNGYEGTALGSHFPSNTDILRLAHEQGALGAYVHPFEGDGDPLEGDLRHARTFPVDLALGTVDYLETSWPSRAVYHVWHQALNAGFRIPLAGGEDSITDLQAAAILGEMRTYAQVGPQLTWERWMAAVRTGHSFVTNGPLLFLEVDGRSPGDEIRLAASGGTVHVRGSVKSIVPLEEAQIVVNGKAIDVGGAAMKASGRSVEFAFRKEIPVSESSWITLQVHGPGSASAQASTNPVWVQAGKRPRRLSEAGEYFVRWIDKLAPMIAALPGWRSPQEQEHVLAQCREARAVYDRIARPRGMPADAPLPTIRARYYHSAGGEPLPPEAPAWKLAAPAAFDQDWDARTRHPDLPTAVTTLWNERTLYLLFEARYLTLNVAAQPDFSKDQWVFLRDCVEFFAAADPNRMGSYKELDFSPEGEWFDARFEGRGDVGWNSGLKIRSGIDRVRKRWWVSVVVPMASLSERVAAGQRWRVNFYRIEGPPELEWRRTHMAWSPTLSIMPNFHVPARFGWMEFVR